MTNSVKLGICQGSSVTDAPEQLAVSQLHAQLASMPVSANALPSSQDAYIPNMHTTSILGVNEKQHALLGSPSALTHRQSSVSPAMLRVHGDNQPKTSVPPSKHSLLLRTVQNFESTSVRVPEQSWLCSTCYRAFKDLSALLQAVLYTCCPTQVV